MIATVDPAALALADRLAGLDHVRSVCLLGSTARGDAEPGSDIDVLAVVDARSHVKDVRRRALRALGARKAVDQQHPTTRPDP